MIPGSSTMDSEDDLGQYSSISLYLFSVKWEFKNLPQRVVTRSK